MVSDIALDGISVSAIEGDVSQLTHAINDMFKEHTRALKKPTLSNERHIAAVRGSYLAMERAVNALEMGIELDLVTMDLNESYRELASVIMPKEDIDILDEIFSRFCLGK